MDQADIIPRIMALTSMILAAGYLVSGGLIIIRKQPLLLRASTSLWLLEIAILPILGLIVYLYFASTPAPTCQSIYFFIAFAGVAYMIWRDSGDYVVIGVRKESLRTALRASLELLGYPYEESEAGFALATMSDTLRVKMTRGTANLHMKSRDNFPALKKIAQAAQVNLRLDRKNVMLGVGWIHVGIGLLLGLITLNFFTGWLMRG